MFNRFLVTHVYFSKQFSKGPQLQNRRNVQISLLGAASAIGSNVSILLKQNPKIRKLQLYDDDEKVKGLALELNHISNGPQVTGFCGDFNLYPAVQASNLILMVSRFPRKPGNTREQMLGVNAPAVHKVCRAVAEQNPDAFFAISTNPLNCIIPFASLVMQNCGYVNPHKLFGITHIDSSRCRCYASQVLKASPRHFCLPVIGGHSEETIIPLFSNLAPAKYSVDSCQADTLTRLVRKAGNDVVNLKRGNDSSVLAMAYSINEFADLLIDAIRGGNVTVNSYIANPYFGTRYFSGPTAVGPNGIVPTGVDYHMNDYESYLLNLAVHVINRDIQIGEDYVNFIEHFGKRQLR